MKNIIAAVFTLLVLVLVINTYNKGGAFHGGEAGNVIEDIKDLNKQVVKKQKDNTNIEEKKLSALRDKAGSYKAFEVSNAYKSKCASCHGVDGSGMQSGKKLMGPKLIGQKEDKLYKDLVDFKDGRKENLVMRGLLINLNDEELKNFAKEIASFQSKKEALNK